MSTLIVVIPENVSTTLMVDLYTPREITLNYGGFIHSKGNNSDRIIVSSH